MQKCMFCGLPALGEEGRLSYLMCCYYADDEYLYIYCREEDKLIFDLKYNHIKPSEKDIMTNIGKLMPNSIRM